jgi:hypothetical protein
MSQMSASAGGTTFMAGMEKERGTSLPAPDTEKGRTRYVIMPELAFSFCE